MSSWLLWALIAYCVCVIFRYSILPRILAWLTGGTGEDDIFKQPWP